ncbi:hypothetical protein XELAEV_18030076mg [Xenopus laevis]|uniref:Uncharacterized protein n=1 Tax=Xenopus laevis TaxID=8355 RepID=A0A974CT17_XENLA|nr:hypothetical protein XELAEV_18030076mg [Xenopus laevis]
MPRAGILRFKSGNPYQLYSMDCIRLDNMPLLNVTEGDIRLLELLVLAGFYFEKRFSLPNLCLFEVRWSGSMTAALSLIVL